MGIHLASRPYIITIQTNIRSSMSSSRISKRLFYFIKTRKSVSSSKRRNTSKVVEQKAIKLQALLPKKFRTRQEIYMHRHC